MGRDNEVCLVELIKKARLLILSGDFASLGSLLVEVEVAILAIDNVQGISFEVEAEAIRCRSLALACLKGIGIAKRRRVEIIAARDCATYGPKGRRSANLRRAATKGLRL